MNKENYLSSQPRIPNIIVNSEHDHNLCSAILLEKFVNRYLEYGFPSSSLPVILDVNFQANEFIIDQNIQCDAPITTHRSDSDKQLFNAVFCFCCCFTRIQLTSAIATGSVTWMQLQQDNNHGLIRLACFTAPLMCRNYRHIFDSGAKRKYFDAVLKLFRLVLSTSCSCEQYHAMLATIYDVDEFYHFPQIAIANVRAVAKQLNVASIVAVK